MVTLTKLPNSSTNSLEGAPAHICEPTEVEDKHERRAEDKKERWGREVCHIIVSSSGLGFLFGSRSRKAWGEVDVEVEVSEGTEDVVNAVLVYLNKA
jgi:hypothetical protein